MISSIFAGVGAVVCVSFLIVTVFVGLAWAVSLSLSLARAIRKKLKRGRR